MKVKKNIKPIKKKKPLGIDLKLERFYNHPDEECHEKDCPDCGGYL